LLFVLGFCSSEFSSQDLPVSCLSIRLGKALSVELFRVALLFICQGTFCCHSQATQLSYHLVSCLSTTFFEFFQLFSKLIFFCFGLSAATIDILTRLLSKVNTCFCINSNTFLAISNDFYLRSEAVHDIISFVVNKA
ncbi:MAG: hypothetical protein IKC46_02440, partial [Lachnospiraceae bacterium]|nr:hypothetical protein [Lachnospiraceae bacterium]